MTKAAVSAVPTRKRRFVEKPDVRAKFLDAAEELILNEGYAAASARAIADRVGMKHQAIFYYFGSQDELLLEVFRRSARHHGERLDLALGSENPIRGMWELAKDSASTGLSIEFMALANHNEAIRAEIAQNAVEIRHREAEAIGAYLKRRGINPRLSPEVVSILTNACARLLVQESTLGIDTGHEAYEALVENSFRAFEASGEASEGIEPIVGPLSQ
jgi:TetR/AcrR family transcriptional regulator